MEDREYALACISAAYDLTIVVRDLASQLSHTSNADFLERILTANELMHRFTAFSRHLLSDQAPSVSDKESFQAYFEQLEKEFGCSVKGFFED